MSLLNELKNETNYNYTENGALTHKTSNSAVLDYFAQGSAFRNRSYDSIISVLTKSLAEDALLTMKILFYSRDVRGGQGERQTFRTIIKYLAENHPNLVVNNINLIPEFGRWDDLYALFGTALENNTLSLIKYQLLIDIKSENPTQLAKWMHSENASSKEGRMFARKTMAYLYWSPKKYRKTLATLRKKINIIETKISEKKYNDINYSKIPSRAGIKYRKAFLRYDSVRYQEFLNLVSEGEVKVNSKTLYPYEIIHNLLNNPSMEDKKLMEGMWNNLPDYIKDSTANDIAVIDVSGSMTGYDQSAPINMAISLGLYLAEKNKGAFSNHFITFSNNPELVEIQGTTLYEKVKNINNANWGGSTNVKATFDLILNTAIKKNIPQEEMPNRIYIISDVEFDDCQCYNNISNETTFEIIKTEYENAGYIMPQLVFWNVDSRNDNIPMTMDEKGVTLVSGANPVLFETLLANEFLGAYEMMIKVIGKDRYKCITI